METWVDAELRNWSRWCNQGGTILPWGIPAIVLFDENEAPVPVHEDNAKRVQKVFDVAPLIERKVLQAEYLSPSRYSRFNGGIPAAVSQINRLDRDLKIGLTVAGYETALVSVKRRVEKVFR